MTSTSTQPINIVPREDYSKKDSDSSLEPNDRSYNDEKEDPVNSIPMSPSNFLW